MNNKKKLARVIATWLVTCVMASVFILDIVVVCLANKYVNNISINEETFTAENGNDKIHFLNTANSDCILLESNGHFALVDSGEGNNNPRRKPTTKVTKKKLSDTSKKYVPMTAEKFTLISFLQHTCIMTTRETLSL